MVLGFSMLNYLAASKILKKADKRMGLEMQVGSVSSCLHLRLRARMHTRRRRY